MAASCQPSTPGTPCYRMWSRKSTDNGVTWLPDGYALGIVSPLPLQPDRDPGTYAGDYDYGSPILNKHLRSWMDGRVAINGQSQQNAFTDRELVGFAVTTRPGLQQHRQHPAGGLRYQPDRPRESSNGPGQRFNGQRNSGELGLLRQGQYADHLPLQQFASERRARNTYIFPPAHLLAQSDNEPNFEFNCTFCYAITPLKVTTTVPPVDDTFSPPSQAIINMT